MTDKPETAKQPAPRKAANDQPYPRALIDAIDALVPGGIR